MSNLPRPEPMAPPHRAEFLFEVLALVAVLSCIATVAMAWTDLPQRVPQHFTALGEPDSYGAKTSLLVPPGLTLGMYLLLSFVQRIPPHHYNYPFEITAKNATAQYRLARLCLRVLKATLSVALAGATWMTTRVALGHFRSLGAEFLLALLVSVLAPLVWYGAAASRHRR